MRVGNSGNNPVAESNAKSTNRAAHTHEPKKGEQAPAVAAKKESHAASAKTDISPKAREFAQAKAAAGQAPDIREGKVEELKKRIADGSYKIDADAIADRLVDDHLKMSGPRVGK